MRLLDAATRRGDAIFARFQSSWTLARRLQATISPCRLWLDLDESLKTCITKTKERERKRDDGGRQFACVQGSWWSWWPRQPALRKQVVLDR